MKVLWVDDEWKPDTPGHELLRQIRENIEAGLRRKQISAPEMVCVAGLSVALAHLATNEAVFELYIIDRSFEHDDSSTEFVGEHIIKQARLRRVPYVVITQHEPPKHEGVDCDPLCLGAFQKHDLLGPRSDGLEAVVAALSAPAVRILHLSDLHYDSNCEPSEASEQRARLGALAEAIRALAERRRIDYVALTGDFAQRSPREDLEGFGEHLESLLGAAGMQGRAEQVFFVPGNHDMLWEDFANRRPSTNSWQEYLRFVGRAWSFAGNRSRIEMLPAWNPGTRAVRSRAVADDLIWKSWAKGSGVLFVGLATTDEARLGANEQGAGTVSDGQLEFLKRACADAPGVGVVKIVLMHHNIMSVISASRLEEPGVLGQAGRLRMALADAGVHVVLSGHTHAPALHEHGASYWTGDRIAHSGRLLSFATGRFGSSVGPGDRERCFEVLDILPSAGFGMRAIHFGWWMYSSSTGKWTERASGVIDCGSALRC